MVCVNVSVAGMSVQYVNIAYAMQRNRHSFRYIVFVLNYENSISLVRNELRFY